MYGSLYTYSGSGACLGAHAQEGYGMCRCLSVCLSVWYHSSFNIVHFCGLSKVCTYGAPLGFSPFLMQRFLKNLPFKTYGEKKPICK